MTLQKVSLGLGLPHKWPVQVHMPLLPVHGGILMLVMCDTVCGHDCCFRPCWDSPGPVTTCTIKPLQVLSHMGLLVSYNCVVYISKNGMTKAMATCNLDEIYTCHICFATSELMPG